MIYKGFTIEEETEPWAIKYKQFFKYYRDPEGTQWAETIEEAKEMIDDRIEFEYHAQHSQDKIYAL
jgi:hypothetical protein